MNILHIITGMNYGGAEKLLLDLCIEQKKKYNVFVIYLKTDGDMRKEFENKNINIIQFKFKKLNLFSLIVKICAFIKKKNIDVVHTHCSHANFIGRTCAILSSVKCIITTIHNTDRWLARKGIIYSALKFYERMLIKPRNSYAIAISKAVKEYIVANEKIDSKKVIIINNAINIENVIDMSKEDISVKYKLTNRDFIICNVGRLVKQKGQIYLLKALNYLINDKKIKNIKCFIVGDGEEKKNLEQYVKDNSLSYNVYFTGTDKNPYKYINKANLFVMPSLWEGFGIVVLEAFALETPVLSTDVDGLKELVVDEYNGKCISARNEVLLGEEILNFYNKQYDTNYFIANSYKILQNYSIEKYFNSVNKLYNKILNN